MTRPSGSCEGCKHWRFVASHGRGQSGLKCCHYSMDEGHTRSYPSKKILGADKCDKYEVGQVDFRKSEICLRGVPDYRITSNDFDGVGLGAKNHRTFKTGVNWIRYGF